MDLSLDIKKAVKKNAKDKIRKNSLHKKNILPNHPSRAAFIGPSGSGKTNLLTTMLLEPHMFYNYFDKIVIFSPSFDADDNYKAIAKKYDKVKTRTEIDVHKKLNIEAINEIMEEQQDVIETDGVHKAKCILMLFDDVINEKEMNDKTLVNLFFRGRHLSISTWITSQSYKKVPRSVRLNLTHLYIFAPSADESKMISVEQRNVMISEKELDKMIRFYTKKRFNFFQINKFADLAEQYRHNLNFVIEIISEE
jgi:hypothetical protein